MFPWEGRGVLGGRGNPGLSRPSLEQGSRGWCAAPREPLREGGREEGHRDGGCRVFPDPRPSSAKAQAQPSRDLFFNKALSRPSLAVWVWASPLERLSCHPTQFSLRVSRCHRAGGLVPGVRLWSLSPLQPDRIWLPSLRLVSGYPCNHPSSFSLPFPHPTLPQLLYIPIFLGKQ